MIHGYLSDSPPDVQFPTPGATTLIPKTLDQEDPCFSPGHIPSEFQGSSKHPAPDDVRDTLSAMFTGMRGTGSHLVGTRSSSRHCQVYVYCEVPECQTQNGISYSAPIVCPIVLNDPRSERDYFSFPDEGHPLCRVSSTRSILRDSVITNVYQKAFSSCSHLSEGVAQLLAPADVYRRFNRIIIRRQERQTISN